MKRTMLLLIVSLAAGGAFAQSPTPSPISQPSPDEIRAALENVIAEGPYELEPSGFFAFDFSWILEYLARLFNWLAEPFENLSFPVAMAIVAVLTSVVFGLLAQILYSFYSSVRAVSSAPVELEKPSIPNAESLENRAKELAAAGNYVDATRSLFRAALVRLELKRGGRVMLALTNREYLGTFRSPWVVENLRIFVDLINWKWYRAQSFDESDYQQCLGAYETLLARLSQEA